MKVKDPVCGMEIDLAQAAGRIEVAGQIIISAHQAASKRSAQRQIDIAVPQEKTFRR